MYECVNVVDSNKFTDKTFYDFNLRQNQRIWYVESGLTYVV